MKENDKTSHRAELMRDIVAMVNQNPVLKQAWQRKKEKSIQNTEFEYPEHLSVEHIDMGLFKMEYLTWNGSENPYVILQLHGGGYIGAMRNAYRMFAGLYNEVSKGMSVLTIDYRVAPENPYPAALEDAVSAYQWLLGQGWFAEDIIVAGDSAGGGLAMALCHYLKDHGMQLPCGIVAMSPWTDLMASGESYDTNYERDPLFGNTRDSLIYNKDYVGDHDPMDAYISPLYGDFRGFPPMLIQVGSYEMLLSDSVSVASKARHQGVKVRLSIYDGMFHIFQMAAKMLPESRKAWAEIGKFIDVLSND